MFTKKVAIPEPRYGYPAHDWGFKLLFGLGPKAKWPRDGIQNPDGSTRDVFVRGDYGTVQLWVDPINTGGGRSKRHRVQCRCPRCGCVMSAGRLQQHARIHG